MIRVQVSWLLQCYPAEGLLIFLHDRLLSTYVLMQNTQVSETREFRRRYGFSSDSKDNHERVTNSVSCYRGDAVTPKWRDADTRKFLIRKT